MATKPSLIGAAVVLRDGEPRDVADRLALGFDPSIIHMFGVDPQVADTIPALSTLTVASVEGWLDSILKRPNSWIIEYRGRLLGDVHLNMSPVDSVAARAELAISLYDTAKLGLGLGREAIRLVLAYAFDTLQLHRVGLRVVSYNERAIRCYSACGFVVEGRVREASLVAGERFDDIIMGIFASEFRNATAGGELAG
jgi:RimJ/RimL family protein N-acetyltransferase